MLNPNLPDPGPPPYCPRCGGRHVGAPQGSSQGVCLTCGSHVRLLHAIEGHPLPFFQELSDLAVHPPACVKLAEQVRAKLRQEQLAREVMAERKVRA